jgi:hypothetical protein
MGCSAATTPTAHPRKLSVEYPIVFLPDLGGAIW